MLDFLLLGSPRSRRLEVVGARGRHACLSREPVFSCAHYFQAPATQVSFLGFAQTIIGSKTPKKGKVLKLSWAVKIPKCPE